MDFRFPELSFSGIDLNGSVSRLAGMSRGRWGLTPIFASPRLPAVSRILDGKTEMMKDDVPRAFAGAGVVVTGGTGMIGREVVRLLCDAGASQPYCSLQASAWTFPTRFMMPTDPLIPTRL